ncbi:hypothetical protein [Soonwooa sp.]|uniref:hypothetical protein n=1 Tax=Soonwooa sp. TaxID=1938592 RepID=UPI0026097649|nr:hypothetical protein [Soonwooa sp.]
MMKKLVLLFALCLLTQTIFGQEKKSVLLTKALQQLNLKESQINLDLFAEKVIPNNNSQSILLIPKYTTNEDDYMVMDAYVLIVDNTSGKILYKNFESGAWVSDAMILSSLTIDTGLYILADQKRAFGVRANTHNMSGPNPFSTEELSLYLIENNKLNKILNSFEVYSSNGEWDMKCAGESTTENSVITVDNQTKSNGLYNLKLKTDVEKLIRKPVKGNCQSKTTKSQKNSVLKFNGKEYK